MIDHKLAGAKVLEAVRAIAMADGVNTDQGETVARAMVKLLGIAWCHAVRQEWQAFVDADPELQAQHAVALELMREDGFTMADEPICGLPGQPASVVKVDGIETVCVDYCMPQVTPLSAIYVDKVRTVQSAAARVSKRLMEEAAKEPQAWPMQIASGETFNSIEEMEQCPIDAVREAARMMRDAEHYRSNPSAPVPVIDTPNVRWHKPEDMKRPDPPAPTCWQYFEFDGPVTLDRLQAAYRGKIMTIGLNNDLAAETHKQYQNCLKELGSAIVGKVPE